KNKDFKNVLEKIVPAGRLQVPPPPAGPRSDLAKPKK
ncbi:MAG: hypothetical protein US50_C0065G0001, partial [Candidatus Nomurabacteria bacterium GW2011_GWB1_37_5]